MTTTLSWDNLIASFKQHLAHAELKSNHTVDAYISDLSHLANTVKKDFPSPLTLTHQDLNTFLSNEIIHKSNASVLRLVSSIKHFYGFLESEGHLSYNPSLNLMPIKKARRLPKVISLDDVNQLMDDNDSIKGRFHLAMIDLLFSCGLRVSELVDLSFNQVFLEESYLRILGKGNKERIVPMADLTKQNLLRYLETDRQNWLKQKSNVLFIKPNGKQVSRQYIYTMLKLKGKNLDLKTALSPHILRHSYATALLQGGADLRIVQELLGHQDISTTQIYTHIDQKRLHDAYDQFHPLQTKKGESHD